MRDRAGTGFWHETYFLRGGMEAVYIDMPPVGLGKVAPLQEARGAMFSARKRAGKAGAATGMEGISESDLYR